jgi:hypothetical protein
MAPAAGWVLVVVLAEWIDESWVDDEVESYDVGIAWEEVLQALAGVNAASLIAGGGR